MSAHSTRKPRRRKAAHDRPKKPYPDFPLYAHPLGYWSKKIRGKIINFGRWGRVKDGKLTRVEGDGWKDALEAYKVRADDLHTGRTPRAKEGELTVKELGDRFLTAKNHKLASGELGVRMFEEYRETCQLVADTFGKERLVDDLAADDFERLRADMAERWGPVRLGNAITRVKSVFKYGVDNGLIEKAMRYGSEFRKPGKSVLRRHKAQNGERMLEADALRKLIDAAGVPLKAMVLLGINCGFGNHDVASLPLSALNVERGWIDFPRPKTGIGRRCPLWPETVAALKAALAERPTPRDKAANDLVFVNSRGLPWVRNTDKSRSDTVAVQFAKLLKELKLHKDGLGFYTLRHVFRTVADAARDPVAIDLIMGHADPSMGGHYRERLEDARLVAVAEHVRAWLFGKSDDGKGKSDEAEAEDATPSEPQATGKAQRPRLRLYVEGGAA
ncbi:MAG: site-specific integrase [Gemmataceae bacterium]|nr:site-specific integrase [Gemmataceae bacterium]MCI0738688.1 site-specific integrase [Gemmataceae bacterium]